MYISSHDSWGELILGEGNPPFPRTLYETLSSYGANSIVRSHVSDALGFGLGLGFRI